MGASTRPRRRGRCCSTTAAPAPPPTRSRCAVSSSATAGATRHYTSRPTLACCAGWGCSTRRSSRRSRPPTRGPPPASPPATSSGPSTVGTQSGVHKTRPFLMIRETVRPENLAASTDLSASNRRLRRRLPGQVMEWGHALHKLHRRHQHRECVVQRQRSEHPQLRKSTPPALDYIGGIKLQPRSEQRSVARGMRRRGSRRRRCGARSTSATSPCSRHPSATSTRR